MRSPEPRDIMCLATDYDRTLTDSALRPSSRALAALDRARRAGRRVIIVSGRDVAFLEREVGHVADAIVGENGAIVLHEGRSRRMGSGHERIRDALACLAIPLERGEILASADVEHEEMLREALARAGVEADLIRNRDRVMVLPRGVDKALGLLAALEALGIAPGRCAAAGDGENDLPLLSAVGYGIAVENAVDELKAIARHVTSRYGGDGLADWIDAAWLPAEEVAA